MLNDREYGGDMNQIYLLGEFSGAHLASLTVLRSVVDISSEDNQKTISDIVQGLILYAIRLY
jgi:acetyl esterase/lipase